MEETCTCEDKRGRLHSELCEVTLPGRLEKYPNGWSLGELSGCIVERGTRYPCPRSGSSVHILGLAAVPASDPENAQKMTAVKRFFKVKLSVQVGGGMRS